MMEKRNFGLSLVAFIFSFFLVGVCKSQSTKKVKKKELKEVERLINEEQYGIAQLEVMSLLNKDSNNVKANFLLGLAYFKDPLKRQLCQLYLKNGMDLIENGPSYYLGVYFSYIEKFEEADRFFTIARNKKITSITSEDIDNQIGSLRRAMDAYYDPQDYEVENLGKLVNSEKNERYPWVSYDQKTLYFMSDKDLVNNSKEKKVYFTEMIEESWKNSVKINEKSENDHHIEVLQWASLGTTYIEDIANKNTKSKKDEGETENFEWVKYSNNTSIPLGYLEANACVNKDNDLMFFAANRSESIGGKDIFVVKKLPNGSWAAPHNLGQLVNSNYDEESPYFHESTRTLYFSSKGHETLGGYDIFKVKLDDNFLPFERTHFGYPLNTTANELDLSVNSSDEIGYFISDRAVGFGGFDLYSSWVSEESRLPSIVKGIIIDEHSNSPVMATVTLIEQETQEVTGVFSTRKDNGTCIILLERGKTYEYYIESDGYIAHEGKLSESLNNITEEGQWKVSLKKDN